VDVLFLGHANTNGCRSRYFFPLLEKAGIQARYVDTPSGPERLKLLESLPPASVAVVQRLALSDTEASVLARKASRLIWDVDDPVMHRSSRHLLSFSPGRRSRFRRMAARCQALVASSALIAAEGRKVLPADRVFVVPSTVDAEIYRPGPPHPAGGTVVLGWLGSAGTLPYLERLGGVLEKVARKADFRLKVVSNRFPSFRGVEVERKPWKQDEEVSDLQSFDVGLLPLTDDLWTRGKGHGKLFQYLAVGIPVVGSPVGVVGGTILDGVTGFLPKSKAAWEESLVRLASDAGLCQRMGRAARKDFEERLSVQAVFPTLLQAIRG